MSRYLTKVAVGVAAALLLAVPGMTAPAHAAVGVAVEVGPDRAPPRLRHEVRPPRPHSGWAWRAGRWDWRDGRYAWVGGEWVEPPHVRAAWVPGHWNHRGRGWVWVEGHWT